MRNLFKVTVEIKTIPERVELFFDSQDRAERFMNMITGMLTDKGKDDVKISHEIASLIDCDEDVIKAFSKITE